MPNVNTYPKRDELLLILQHWRKVALDKLDITSVNTINRLIDALITEEINNV